jgi:hypothetical protein
VGAFYTKTKVIRRKLEEQIPDTLESISADSRYDQETAALILSYLYSGPTNKEELSHAQVAEIEERTKKIVLLLWPRSEDCDTDAEPDFHFTVVQGEAIFLVGVGVSSGSAYNDALMDTVTDWGKGA